MGRYQSAEGVISSIEPVETGMNKDERCCYLFISVRTGLRDVVNFIVDNNTYFIDNQTLRAGDSVIGFYDTTVPVPLIYPPQYRAVVMAQKSSRRFVKVAVFDNELVSDDGSLKLNISPATKVIMRNNQTYLCNIAGKSAAVVYTNSTKSYPAITTPSQVIILCQ